MDGIEGGLHASVTLTVFASVENPRHNKSEKSRANRLSLSPFRLRFGPATAAAFPAKLSCRVATILSASIRSPSRETIFEIWHITLLEKSSDPSLNRELVFNFLLLKQYQCHRPKYGKIANETETSPTSECKLRDRWERILQCNFTLIRAQLNFSIGKGNARRDLHASRFTFRTCHRAATRSAHP